MTYSLRPATLQDIEPCGQILFEAFDTIAKTHQFPADFPSLDIAKLVVKDCIESPTIFAIVAEKNGQLVGSNFLHKYEPIYGIGPISVAPWVQQAGIGKQLMQAVIEEGRNAMGIGLIQDAFNLVSMSLYTSLGFDLKEPLLLMKGKPKDKPLNDIRVRPLTLNDLEDCAMLCQKVYGFDRTQALVNALDHDSAFVAQRNGQIVAYTASITFWPANHSVALNDEDLSALLLGAAELCDDPLSFLLPTRRSNFFRWCLQQGFRAVNPRNLMAYGAYETPQGSYLPSVFY